MKTERRIYEMLTVYIPGLLVVAAVLGFAFQIPLFPYVCLALMLFCALASRIFRWRMARTFKSLNPIEFPKELVLGNIVISGELHISDQRALRNPIKIKELPSGEYKVVVNVQSNGKEILVGGIQLTFGQRVDGQNVVTIQNKIPVDTGVMIFLDSAVADESVSKFLKEAVESLWDIDDPKMPRVRLINLGGASKRSIVTETGFGDDIYTVETLRAGNNFVQVSCKFVDEDRDGE